jgi:ribosomal protein S6
MARNEDDIEVDDTSPEEGGASRVYELGFHLDPELPTEEVKKAYQAIRAAIAERGALVAEGEPEKIPLAYTISRQEPSGRRDFDSAYFAWIAYETSAANHAEVIAALTAEKRVIRFIDLVTTKDAARHAAEMHELSAKVAAPVEAPDTADAEIDAAIEHVAV